MFDDDMIFSHHPSKQGGPHISASSLIPILTAEELLSKIKRQWWLNKIEELADLPDEHYNALYRQLIENFAEFVQILPTTPGNRLGGLLGEGLGRAYLALKELRSNKTPSLLDQNPRYIYALFSSALLLDIAKPLDHYQCMISDEEGKAIRVWQPFAGSMVGQGEFYKLRKYAATGNAFQRHAVPLLAHAIMPPEAFAWLAEDHMILNLWLAQLQEESGGAGGLGLYLQHILHEFHEEISGLELFLLHSIKFGHPPETEAGEKFLEWLQKGIKDEKINVNDMEGDVFVTAEGVFVAMDLFRDFVSHYSTYRDYTVVYKQFNYLGLTAKSGNDYKHMQYFGEGPEAAGRKEKLSKFASGFLGKGAAAGSGYNAAPSKVHAREGVMIRDSKYVFLHSDIPAIAKNVKAVLSVDVMNELLPKILPQEYGRSPNITPDAGSDSGGR